jgi:hypothetical protein
MTQPNGKRSRIVAIAAAVVTVATPGVYASWQAAKSAWQAKTEQRVSDKTTTDLQAWAAVAKVKLDALEKSCVSHRDLVDFALKLGHADCREGWELRGNRCIKTRVVATAPPVKAISPQPPPALLDKLKARAKAAPPSRSKLPTLKTPDQVRSMIQQTAE